jgi:flagellar basal-body rod protein FlgC
MAVTEIMSVSEFGMHYQKMRVDAATTNIANANVVQPLNEKGFKPLTVVVQSGFEKTLFNKDAVQLTELSLPDKKVFQPEHLAADSQGFVHFANIDMAEQMVTITEATRAYEANVKAFNAQMNMSIKALELGK